jgi:hypothetical protein
MIPNPEPPVVWFVESDDVDTIWRSTNEVFGNSLWHTDVDEVLDSDRYREVANLVEERSGQSLFNCVMDAVANRFPKDSSEVFAYLHRAFAEYGVDLQFADHYRYGNLLERAARSEAGEPTDDPPRVHVFDEWSVVGLWNNIENNGYEDCSPTDWLDADYADDIQQVVDGGTIVAVGEMVDGLPPDADPSLFYQALQRVSAGYGIHVTFAPHPEHGDVLERAARITAGEPA